MKFRPQLWLPLAGVRVASPRKRKPWEHALEHIDWIEHDWAKDPSPLLEALRALPLHEPLPGHLRMVLIALLTRH